MTRKTPASPDQIHPPKQGDYPAATNTALCVDIRAILVNEIEMSMKNNEISTKQNAWVKWSKKIDVAGHLKAQLLDLA